MPDWIKKAIEQYRQ